MSEIKNTFTSKQLILNLQDAGITNRYVNLILKTIEEEKKAAFYDGFKTGKEATREALLEHVNESENYNGQFLKHWLKNTTL